MPLWPEVVIVVIAFVLIEFVRRRRRLQKELSAEETPRRLVVLPLSAQAREQYREAWASLQEHFDEEPEATIRDADRLIQNVMRERGFPTGDFGRASEELTAEQVDVLEAYRVAHRISVKAETDLIPTEDAQRAHAALRSLFEALLLP